MKLSAPWRHSLITRIVFFGVITVAFFGICASILVYSLTSQELFSLKRSDITLISESKIKVISQVFDYSRQLVTNISISPDVVDLLSKPIIQSSEMVKLLTGYDPNQYYSAIYLIDAKGNTLVSTDPSFVNKNYSFRQYFQKAFNGQTFIDVAYGVTSKQLGYYISAPIKKDNYIIGVAVAKLKPEVVDRLFNPLHQETSGIEQSLMMADENGVIIGADKPNRLYHSLGTIANTTIKNILETKSYPFVPQGLGYEQVQSNVVRLAPAGIVDFYCTDDRQKELIYFGTIPNTNFWLVNEVSADSISQGIGNIVLAITAVVILSVFGTILILTLILRSSLAPISQIAAAADEISNGGHPDIKPISRSDEIGRLSQSISNMANKLLESKAEVEKQVIERTSQLEKLNRYFVDRELKMIELKSQINCLKFPPKAKKK